MRKDFITFKNGDFNELRYNLLDDLSQEQFALLLGKRDVIDDVTFIKVIDIYYPNYQDYHSQSLTHLNLEKEFIFKYLIEIQERFDVDTLIDVHTHPFTSGKVNFSSVDDRDETQFFNFLKGNFDDIFFASIVLSQNEYSARVWVDEYGNTVSHKALIKTQTISEQIPSSDLKMTKGSSKGDEIKNKIYDRSILALGVDTMRKISEGETISIVGVGGLGSIIAENLIHMGFHHLNLIDNDILEYSNLNRVSGAYYEDIENKIFKVDAVKRHLSKINPHVTVNAFANDVYDSEVEKVIALSDWVIVATDNHSSRFRTQTLSIKYFIPMISVGVNITVDNDEIADMSGEVITIRIGDNLCLNCLGRIDAIKIASERHPDKEIKEALVDRGYVNGVNVHEPAVKTLNSQLASMAVDLLINEYTNRQKHKPIIVFENNKTQCIYEDRISLERRNKHCFTCNI